MLVAAAVCPHPPLLVPQLAAGAAAETEDLRAACREAVAGLLAAGPDVLAVVGGAAEAATFPGDAPGSTAPYGVEVRVGRPGRAVLPLALTVASWLLDACGVTAPRTLHAVAERAAPQECADLGAALVRSAPRVALLVMGDGTACLSERAPGYVDPRAAGYDDAVAAALGSADEAALLALDPALARELRVAGRAAWQVAAGAAGTAPGRCEGRLLARQAPYGVSYLVAAWSVPAVRRDL